MAEKTINIGGRLHSTATGNVVAAANEIFDYTKNKNQEEINANTYSKEETYNKNELNNLITTPDVQHITVPTFGSLPESGSADTIYRVSNWDGGATPPAVDASKYSEYAWDGSGYVLLSVKSAVDEVFDVSVFNAESGVAKTYETLTAALGGVPANRKKGGMSIKFIQTTPATYNVVKTEGVTELPTGTLLDSASSVASGTYTASQLTDFSTLPTTSAVTYYVAVTEDETTTYTTWVITLASAESKEYVQYRLMKTDWSNVVGDWQGVDKEPTAGSKNLVESGGVYRKERDILLSTSNDKLEIGGAHYFDESFYHQGGINSNGTRNNLSIRVTCYKPLPNGRYKVTCTGDVRMIKSVRYKYEDTIDEGGTSGDDFTSVEIASTEHQVKVFNANDVYPYLVVNFARESDTSSLITVDEVSENVTIEKLDSIEASISDLSDKIDSLNTIKLINSTPSASESEKLVLAIKKENDDTSMTSVDIPASTFSKAGLIKPDEKRSIIKIDHYIIDLGENEGAISNSDGSIIANASYGYTDEIELTNGFIFSGFVISSAVAAASFYDANHFYLGGINVSSGKFEQGDFVGAKYVRFSGHKNNSNPIVLKTGNLQNIDTKSIINNSIGTDKVDFIAHVDGTNLIDLNSLALGYINNKGQIKDYSTIYHTEFIPLNSNTQYYFSNIITGYYAFYGEDYSIIEAHGNDNTLSSPFTVPEGTVYGRFSIMNSNVNDAWLSTSNEVPEAYKETINPNLLPVVPEQHIFCDYDGIEFSIFNRCLFIGDSLVEGVFNYRGSDGHITNYYTDKNYSIPTYVHKLTGVETVNKGHGGLTSEEWYNYEKNSDLSGFDCAVIHLGYNDVGRYGEVGERTKTAYDNIINKLKEENKKIKIFVCTVFPGVSYNGEANGVNPFIRNYIANLNDENVMLADIAAYGHVGDKPAYNLGHFSAYGYLVTAKDLKSLIGYIIATNKSLFSEVQFINTDYYFNA